MNERYAAALHDINSNFPAFHTIGARAYRPGLEDTLMLAEMFSNPHKRFRSIHIAGTNGKGTTAHTIAAALKAAGYTPPATARDCTRRHILSISANAYALTAK